MSQELTRDVIEDVRCRYERAKDDAGVAICDLALSAIGSAELVACKKCGGKGIVPIGDGYSVNPCPDCHPPRPSAVSEERIRQIAQDALDQCCCRYDPAHDIAGLNGIEQAIRTALRESGEQEARDARLGAAVRRMLSEGPWNLEDSPKSFLSNCKRLAQESAAIEGEKHD